MKLPYLKSWDRTPVIITITDGIASTGEPNEVASYTGKCNYSEKAKTVRNSDGQYIQLGAIITIGCDIAPSVPVLAGDVEIAGKVWKIFRGDRPRNPDQSVNHTRLELI